MIMSGEWLYFLAGALLPTVAYFFLHGGGSSKNSKKRAGDVDNNDDGGGDGDDDESDEDEMNQATKGGSSASWGFANAPYKMVFLVNQELPMGKGKVAAQCCHAAVGCYKRAGKQCPSGLRAWEYSGCAKIALKCPTQDEMEEIAARALSMDIPIYLVADAGRTQIAAGSRTVLGLFGPVAVFEGLTSHLKLM